MEGGVEIERGPISVVDFHCLARSVGWGEVEPNIYSLAISNSIACVHALADGHVIGFGRLVGDKGMYVYIQDLIVDKRFQGKGIGRRIMKELESITRERGIGRGKINLIAANEVCGFYEKIGYEESVPVSKIMKRSV